MSEEKNQKPNPMGGIDLEQFKETARRFGEMLRKVGAGGVDKPSIDDVIEKAQRKSGRIKMSDIYDHAWTCPVCNRGVRGDVSQCNHEEL